MRAGRLLPTANQGSAEGLRRPKNQTARGNDFDLPYSKKKPRDEVARSEDVAQ